MLSRLSIQNYAIIDRLEVDFTPQLNIITGETGAGKSIIVGALGLILGERAESNVLLNREKKCIVEGCFKTASADEQVDAFLRAGELDVHDELVVRREIAPNGKSRAFINDTPVNLSQLQQLGSLLVDLHQQFDTLELGETDFQREVLDALAGNFPAVKTYRSAFDDLQAARKNLSQLKEQKTRFDKEFDYHQFQYNELEEAAFRENELEDLELELKLQSNAEGIRNALGKAYYELEEGEQPIVRQIKSLISGLQQYAEWQADLPALLQRLQSAYLELQDIAGEADRISNHISSDAARLERINERLSLGYRLLKKHGVKSTGELLEIKNGLNEKLQAVLNMDEAIVIAEKELADHTRNAEEQAARISEKRRAQVKPLEQQVNKMLTQVGMPNARLKAELRPGNLTATGADSPGREHLASSQYEY